MSAQNPSASTTTPSPSDNMSSPSRKRSGTMSTGMAVAVAVILLLVGLGGGYVIGYELNKGTSTSKTTVTETGSSLLYPLMESWAPNYTAYNPNVLLSPASTGSGTGQADAEQGLINIGGSDGYL